MSLRTTAVSPVGERGLGERETGGDMRDDCTNFVQLLSLKMKNKYNRKKNPNKKILSELHRTARPRRARASVSPSMLRRPWWLELGLAGGERQVPFKRKNERKATVKARSYCAD